MIVPTSGGGLIGGVSTAIKAISPRTAVYGAEPAALPRYSVSLKAGKPVQVEKRPTVADGLVSQMPGDVCFPCVEAHTDAFAAVEDAFILKGMKLLLLEGKLLCEPSSAIGIGAVLQGLIPVMPEERVCFFISGGSFCPRSRTPVHLTPPAIPSYRKLLALRDAPFSDTSV